MNVHADKPCKFYVFLVKQLFHNEKHTEVTVSGVGMNIFQVIKVTEILTRFKYATVSRIKTHSYQPPMSAGGPMKKAAKVVITLTKSSDFEQLYADFEKSKPEMPERRDYRGGERRFNNRKANTAKENTQEDDAKKNLYDEEKPKDTTDEEELIEKQEEVHKDSEAVKVSELEEEGGNLEHQEEAESAPIEDPNREN